MKAPIPNRSLNPRPETRVWSRREMLCRLGGGFGALALGSVFSEAGLLAAPPSEPAPDAQAFTLNPKAPHFAPRAKRIIFLFMNGGPSHVDTFDPKPSLIKYAGQTPDAIEQKTGRKKGRALMPSPFTWKSTARAESK